MHAHVGGIGYHGSHIDAWAESATEIGTDTHLQRRLVVPTHAHQINEVSTPERLAFSPAEVASTLGTSKSWVYLRIEDGTIPSVRLAGRRLIRREALVALLADLEQSGGDAA